MKDEEYKKLKDEENEAARKIQTQYRRKQKRIKKKRLQEEDDAAF